MFTTVSENSIQPYLHVIDIYESQETELKEYSTMILTSCTSLFIDMMADVSTRAPISALSIW